MTPVQIALTQIRFARDYTNRLLDKIPSDLWYRMPTEGVTHVAWQAGHIAVAQYRLALQRIRGELPEDLDLIPLAFQQQFMKDSQPQSNLVANPSVDEIRTVLDRVHEQVVREVPEFPEAHFDALTPRPHPLFQTLLGSLVWCGQHEMLHAGQIGLLRRLLGHSPIW